MSEERPKPVKPSAREVFTAVVGAPARAVAKVADSMKASAEATRKKLHEAQEEAAEKSALKQEAKEEEKEQKEFKQAFDWKGFVDETKAASNAANAKIAALETQLASANATIADLTFKLRKKGINIQ